MNNKRLKKASKIFNDNPLTNLKSLNTLTSDYNNRWNNSK